MLLQFLEPEETSAGFPQLPAAAPAWAKLQPTGSQRTASMSLFLTLTKRKPRHVARAVSDRKGSALPICVDVTNGDSVEEAFAAIEAWRKPPDVLVNSAGIMRIASLAACSLADFRTVMDVNVTGTFLCAQRTALATDHRCGKHGRSILSGQTVVVCVG
jgi:NAD(P)-dependent dehydrogenase (short-subunit alcohol dehydrogenase family)